VRAQRKRVQDNKGRGYREQDVDVDVDVALIGCPAHGGQGYIAAVAALLNAYFRLSQAARIESLNPTASSCNSELNETCI